MIVYKQIYGDLRVPAKFVIPDDDDRWSRLSRGLKLGVRVAAIRSAGRYVKERPERKAELDSIGFEWRIRDHTHKQTVAEELFDRVYTALVQYKSIYGNVEVPESFIVPEDNSWSSASWGLALGDHVREISLKDKLVYGHEDREARLTTLGFPMKDSGKTAASKKRFDIIIQALQVYKNLFGDVLVPHHFVVPKEEPWEEDLHCIKLGARVHAMRQGTLVANHPERR